MVSKRLRVIDAARGSGFAFVCLSHFAGNYLLPAGAARIGGMLIAIGMIASPTLVLVSGMTTGYIHAARPEGFTAFRRFLLHRGIFLLTAVHALLLAAAMFDGVSRPLGRGFVTDAIGIAIILGPPLVAWCRARTRLVLGSIVLAAGWGAAFVPLHASSAWYWLQAFLVGETYSHAYQFNFPILPWFGVYLVGTALGERLQRAGSGSSAWHESRVLLTTGAGLFCLALLGVGFAHAPEVVRALEGSHAPVLEAVSPWQKYPPSPVYLALFGGAGLLLAGLLGVCDGVRRLSAVVEFFAVIGRASLLVFVLQAWLLGVLVMRLHLPYTAAWPLLLVALTVGLQLAARAWSRRDLNRYLSWPALARAIRVASIADPGRVRSATPIARAVRPEDTRTASAA